MAANVQSESEMIQQFTNITGTDKTVAKNMLEAFNNNLEMAINMFLEGHSSEQEEVHEVPPKSDVCIGGSTASNASDSSDSSGKRKKHSNHAKLNSQKIRTNVSSSHDNGLL